MTLAWDRRRLIRAGLGLLAAPTGFAIASGRAAKARAFRLIETAGLRRYGFPVHILSLPLGDETQFRLSRSGRPVPAQFRVIDDGGRRWLAVDFNASPGPFETEEYRIEPGVDGVEPAAGLTVEPAEVGPCVDPVRVRSGPDLRYVFSSATAGLLDSVVNGRVEFIAGAGTGFGLRDAAGRPATALPAGPPSCSLLRRGPLAVGLRRDFAVPGRGRGPSTNSVEVTVPRSKSWVEVSWSVDNASRSVAALDFGIDLKVGEGPTLVDFGAEGTVYGQIKGDESMTMAGGGTNAPAWSVSRGPADHAQVVAKARPGQASRAEGWAHVMDKSRCVAVAVDAFGRETRDRLIVRADGRLGIAREYVGTPPDRLQLRFWLHFVGMPVQVGALTSPQAMMAPLRVEGLP